MPPLYDRRQSYAWNYEHVPSVAELVGAIDEIPPITGEFSLAGLSLGSPLGIAAGPLLNGDWCRCYAALGFDWVTYKTVRSEHRDSYPIPNLQPVACREPILDAHQTLVATDDEATSWAVSFGMPSRSPEIWQADVRSTRSVLPSPTRLSVSVVGSRDQHLATLAADYAECAKRAVASGAEFVEANFSCPNVTTCDGQLYQSPWDSAVVAQQLREAVSEKPLLIKIGFLPTDEEAARLVEALSPWVDVIVTTNGMTAKVAKANGEMMFAGMRRGICGDVIREASLRQVDRFRQAIDRAGSSLEIVGVGGIRTYEHVRQYLDAGAQAVQLATAAMLDPWVGVKIRQAWPAKV